MNLTLTFAEPEIRDTKAPDKMATLERIALDVIRNGGVVVPTLCHDSSARKRLTTPEQFTEWQEAFTKNYGM